MVNMEDIPIQQINQIYPPVILSASKLNALGIVIT
jgi:hypothetical protein